jgi:membrane associated rhomboid family serine protease
MSLTLILVIMTGLVSFQAFNNPELLYKLRFHPVSIKDQGQWYRFLSHGFVHASWEHLLINMFVLYQFGEFIEYMFNGLFGDGIGRIMYLVMYLSAIVIASIPSYFKNEHNTYYSAVGASGATSALVFAYILFQPWGWFIFPPLPAILFGVAFLWYSSYMEKRGMDNIGHNAHFWGAVYGVAFTVISAAVLNPDLIDMFIYQLLQGPTPPSFLR